MPQEAGTQLARTNNNKQPSMFEMAVRGVWEATKTRAKVPIVVGWQDVLQNVNIGRVTSIVPDWFPGSKIIKELPSIDGGGILPKTRRGATYEGICKAGWVWRETTEGVMKYQGPHRTLQGQFEPRDLSNPVWGPDIESHVPVLRGTRIATEMAVRIIGRDLHDSVMANLYTHWQSDRSTETTVVEAQRGLALEREIVRRVESGQTFTFADLEQSLVKYWRKGVETMWAKTVVDTKTRAEKIIALRQVLGQPIPLIRMSGVDIIRAGLAGKTTNLFMWGAITGGGVHVGVFAGKVKGRFGMESDTIAGVGNLDADVRDINNSIEMALPLLPVDRIGAGFEDDTPLAKRWKEIKSRKLQPRIRINFPTRGRKLIETQMWGKRKRRSDVLGPANILVGDLRQGSQITFGVLDAPMTIDAVEKILKSLGKALGMLGELRTGMVVEDGVPMPSANKTIPEQVGVDITKPMFKVVEDLETVILARQIPADQFVPRPEKVLASSPRAVEIFNQGPDIDNLMTRIVRNDEYRRRGGTVLGSPDEREGGAMPYQGLPHEIGSMEASKAYEILSDFNHPTSKRIMNALKDTSVNAGEAMQRYSWMLGMIEKYTQ